MIALKGLQVHYGGRPVIHGVDLEVESGEFVTLLGPSGCGKSTLLRAVGGFVPVAGGRIDIDGVDVTNMEPEERDIGFVFQSYALFPHLSVEQNVAFGLRVRKIRGAERRRRVREALEATDLTDFAQAMPAQLSGGQQQRVAIARVLVTQPSVLLMDEPLSNLDALLRVRLRDEIRRLHEQLGITTLYVTHDQEEALALSDRVVIMRDGRFEQVDTPHAVYHRPANSYVCTFVGSANALEPAAVRAFDLDHVGLRKPYIRPERVRLGEDAFTAHHSRGLVTSATFLGVMTRYAVEVNGQTITVVGGSETVPRWRPGDQVECGFEAKDLLWLAS